MANRLYRELEHTADLGVEVDADSPANLFRRAGLTLYALMVEPVGIESRRSVSESIEASGWEELLHDWLAALLRRFFVDGFVAADITIDEIREDRLSARLAGETLDLARHSFLTEIKGVTYHQLTIERCARGWRARIIFDV